MKKNLIVSVLMLLMPLLSFSQESKWTGKWTSNGFTLETETAANLTLNIELHLCSDKHAIFMCGYHVLGSTDEANIEVYAKECILGEWSCDDRLKIKPNKSLSNMEITGINTTLKINYYNGYRLSNSDKLILEEQLNSEMKRFMQQDCSLVNQCDKDGFLYPENLKSSGMVLTKEDVQLPYYAVYPPSNENGPVECAVIDFQNVPFLGLVRAAVTDNSKGTIEIGLFLRKNRLIPCYTKAYKMDGSLIHTEDSKLLSYEDKEREMKIINEYLDSKACPKSGNASFKYSDGRTFTGEWKESKPSGTGKETLPDGSWKEGEWSDGVFVSGKGKIIFADNSSYIGDIKGDKPDGKGEKTTFQGRYTGQWEQGVLANGTAILNLGNGMSYEGGIVNDKMSGEGRMTCKFGEYIGIWENGSFKKGSISSYHENYPGAYKYEGTVEAGSFADGECVFDNGCTMKGKWNGMKLCEGTIALTANDDAYPIFNGKVSGGKLTSGSFRSKAGYEVSSEWNNRTSSDNLVIEFTNGDTATGVWDISTGILVEASCFEYKWADGVKCVYMVGKEGKLSKPAYYDADGGSAKAGIAKGRMQFNTDGKTFTLTPISLDKIKSVLEAKVNLPN